MKFKEKNVNFKNLYLAYIYEYRHLFTNWKQWNISRNKGIIYGIFDGRIIVNKWNNMMQSNYIFGQNNEKTTFFALTFYQCEGSAPQ